MAALPDRRPRAIDGGKNGTPKSAILAVTITISVLAAFALGVLVGRSQTGTLPTPTNDTAPQTPPAEVSPAPEPAAPEIEMIRPDGSKAIVEPQAVPAPTAEPAADLAAPTPSAQGTKPESPQVAAPKQTPAPVPTAQATPPTAGGIYTVQIAAFRDRESAERLSLLLESRGYDAYVQRSDVDGKGLWYRVRVGAFNDKEAARELAKKLEAKEGRSAYVTIR